MGTTYAVQVHVQQTETKLARTNTCTTERGGEICTYKYMYSGYRENVHVKVHVQAM